MKEILGWCAAFVALLLIGWGTSWFGLVTSRPMKQYAEETRRLTYDQSRSYQQGMVIDLDELCRQRKLAADEGVKATLADTIRLRSARFAGELPSHVQECVNEVR